VPGRSWTQLDVVGRSGRSGRSRTQRLDSWVVGMTTGLLILQRGSNSGFRAANEATKPAVER
jgi:hypothetical protein